MQTFTSEINVAAGQADSARVEQFRKLVDGYFAASGFVQTFTKPYVEGVADLPADGRFLLVANHVLDGSDAPLIMSEVSRHTGKAVRPLVIRHVQKLPEFFQDLVTAIGAKVGSPENATELMQAAETVLVFPGGAREMGRGKGELHQLDWGDRKGFARVAVEHGYTIIPTAMVGPDFRYRMLTERGGRFDRAVDALRKALGQETDLPGMQLRAGIANTPLPYPQRTYLRFSKPIETVRPPKMNAEKWIDTVRNATKDAIETGLAELLDVREHDPFRNLAPWARERASVAP